MVAEMTDHMVQHRMGNPSEVRLVANLSGSTARSIDLLLMYVRMHPHPHNPE